MVETTFNLFDACIIGITFLSTLLSFFRGFVRELLSLGSWIGAMIVTLLYAPDLANEIKADINKGDAAAMVAASVLLFFGAKIIFSLLNLLLMKLLKSGKDIGVLDNLLGMLFGFLRAALLISLGYYVYSIVAPEDNQPEWIAQAATKPAVAKGARLLQPFLEDFVEEITPMIESHAEQIEEKGTETFNQLLYEAEAKRKLEAGESLSPDELEQLMQHMEQEEPSPAGSQPENPVSTEPAPVDALNRQAP